MTETLKPLVSLDEVQSFLDRHHGSAVDGLEQLSGGVWSAAFGYRAGGDELVARFGSSRDWYETDQRMHRFAAADLPIPRVRDVGEAMNGMSFAISERVFGRFLEDIEPSESRALSATVARLLSALRVTRIARGVPVGGELEYVDTGTLAQAVVERRPV